MRYTNLGNSLLFNINDNFELIITYLCTDFDNGVYRLDMHIKDKDSQLIDHVNTTLPLIYSNNREIKRQIMKFADEAIKTVAMKKEIERFSNLLRLLALGIETDESNELEEN